MQEAGIGLHLAVLKFADKVRGKKLRGQIIDGVNLDIDTISQPICPLRFIVRVCFKENPVPEGVQPEEALLVRVFSEIPPWATYTTHDVEQLLSLLSSDGDLVESEWFLADESKEQKQ